MSDADDDALTRAEGGGALTRMAWRAQWALGDMIDGWRLRVRRWLLSVGRKVVRPFGKRHDDVV